MLKFTGAVALVLLAGSALPATAAPVPPTVSIRLPEKFRLLENQYFDLRVEATGLANPATATLTIFSNGYNVTASLPAPEVSTDNDNVPADLDKAWTFRKLSFGKEGPYTLEARVTDANGVTADEQNVCVHEFDHRHKPKNFILFIGDAMGTAYRDAGRLVAKSMAGGLREGFFDELQEMDEMPVSGMVMTYAMDRVAPDSANTATAWASGNKTIDGALNTFPDNTDFKGGSSQTAKVYFLDNPRVETLWEYLRRRCGYATGIITTSDVTDATPAGQGGHTISRGLLKDIAKQYVDGAFVPGPAFDVILGGGKEQFDARTLTNAGDTRNLANELQALGFTYVNDRTALNAVPAGTKKLLGLFRTSHMNVAYDKLGLVRPPDEVAPPTNGPVNFAGFTNQPFLDEMTRKGIEVLSDDGRPFILMVEGASIDKQSHPNNAAGQLWDTIEFDKAIGVGRAYASKSKKTLVCVSADHDQSMCIIGVVDTTIPSPIPAPWTNTNVRSTHPYPFTKTVGSSVGGSNVGEVDGFPDYEDTNGDGYPENTNRFKLAIGYRTGNHTGSSVPITAEGPGALLFTGYFDQTEIFFKAARILSMSTEHLDHCLGEVGRAQPGCEEPRHKARKSIWRWIRKHLGHDGD